MSLMKITPRIRRYDPGEEAALFHVFYTAVHQVASREYSPEQVQAWAPADLDSSLWKEQIGRIKPFVADLKGEPVGYADLQANGYIDHFFVAGNYARCGVGTALMHHILSEARAAGMPELTADVSRTAQPLFEKFGFAMVEQRQVERRGVVIPNAFMRLRFV